jgi:hypothetical protein
MNEWIHSGKRMLSLVTTSDSIPRTVAIFIFPCFMAGFSLGAQALILPLLPFSSELKARHRTLKQDWARVL